MGFTITSVSKIGTSDFGDKKITVNCIAPGGIKTDMWVEAARKYIPGADNYSDEKVDEVRKFSLYIPRVTQYW